ncbi:hypothetical protein FKW77_004542 [Venturia effusa]|uniref:Major facilitator superfamily (MFS) profile domain-containing protein n=1 Tax=Venturia effusa TaxID=50376 RepID=A0A517L959_9PEZI|nr:hypothetical protein FKW77_004542 [Venturia effusa]
MDISLQPQYQDLGKAQAGSIFANEKESRSRIPTDLALAVRHEGFALSDDGEISWTDYDSIHHPSKWSTRRKLFDTTVILFFEFFTTVISNSGSLSAVQSHDELKIDLVPAVCIFTTTYLGGQVIGCIFLPPYTETFGRKPTYIVSSLVYGLANIIVGTPGNLASIICGRLICGIISAIPTAVTAGSLEEIWSPHERIWAIQAWVAAFLVGLAIAPAITTAIGASTLGWRWVYHISAIVLVINSIVFIFIRESRPIRILRKEIRRLTLKHNFDHQQLSIRHADHVPDLRTFLRLHLLRPINLFCTEPIVFAVAVMGATVEASAYLMTEVLPKLYEGFGYDIRKSGLVFLALGLGAITLPLLTRLYDARISKNKGAGLLPEDKLLGFYIAAPIQAIALWWFAWSTPPHATSQSPFISISSLILIGFAINEFDYVLIGYLCDTYTTVAGSANAPLSILRALLIAVYPLFAPALYDDLGNNVAGSVLAGIASLYCFVAVAFWKFGARLRRRSPWVLARKDSMVRKQSLERDVVGAGGGVQIAVSPE